MRVYGRRMPDSNNAPEQHNVARLITDLSGNFAPEDPVAFAVDGSTSVRVNLQRAEAAGGAAAAVFVITVPRLTPDDVFRQVGEIHSRALINSKHARATLNSVDLDWLFSTAIRLSEDIEILRRRFGLDDAAWRTLVEETRALAETSHRLAEDGK